MVVRFDEGIVYDTFGEEWKYKAILIHETVWVTSNKSGSSRQVCFGIPYIEAWDEFPGKALGINKIAYEIHRRID